jgi:hypothetical protein
LPSSLPDVARRTASKDWLARSLFDAQDEIEGQRDSMIGAIEATLTQSVSSQGVISVSWSLQ